MPWRGLPLPWACAGSCLLPHAPAFLLQSPGAGSQVPPAPRCGRNGAWEKPRPWCHQPVAQSMACPSLGLLLALGLPLLLARWDRAWGQSRYRRGHLGPGTRRAQGLGSGHGVALGAGSTRRAPRFRIPKSSLGGENWSTIPEFLIGAELGAVERGSPHIRVGVVEVFWVGWEAGRSLLAARMRVDHHGGHRCGPSHSVLLLQFQEAGGWYESDTPGESRTCPDPQGQGGGRARGVGEGSRRLGFRTPSIIKAPNSAKTADFRGLIAPSGDPLGRG